MENIAGHKPALTWVTRICVLVLVILWLVPTVGLFVSSFRDRDDISASPWWQAPFPTEQTSAARISGAKGHFFSPPTTRVLAVKSKKACAVLSRK